MTPPPYLQFQISTGQLTSFDSTGTKTVVGSAYSGAPGYVNDPDATAMPDRGPIPSGLWSIGAPVDDPVTGIFTLPLGPLAGTETYGRSEFKIHGPNAAKDKNGSQASSTGCIVAAHPERSVASTFSTIEVIP
jgi:hypothetical protein